MAPSPRTSSRQDATALPSMSSTFWAFMILASLLIAYCSQLAAGTCEIVTLDRDSSQPRRTIARQTARCACRKGQIAGTTRARPACVDDKTLLDSLHEAEFTPIPKVSGRGIARKLQTL
ncbi:chemokine-like protein TAFA-5 isoform X2 [Tursiops truncatus]|uniref:chemokine-like protein TAFA-5 isoform X2 n=1 Tax=Tursiops truncatus TaxID=9739 RepID=UPI003CCF03AD